VQISERLEKSMLFYVDLSELLLGRPMHPLRGKVDNFILP